MQEQKPIVYLVDDDPLVLRALAKVVERHGYDIETCSSAGDFLDKYSGQPGCVVLDLGGKEISGLDVQQQLLSNAMTLPVIFTTESGRVPETVKAIKAGAVDCLEKPFVTEILLERIEEAIKIDERLRSGQFEKSEIQSRLLLLTDRERDIYNILVSSEKLPSSKEIGQQLGISHRTVEHHRSRILEKTRTRSTAELLLLTRQSAIPTSD